MWPPYFRGYQFILDSFDLIVCFFLLKKGAISNFKFFSSFFEKILGIFVPGPGPVSTGTTRSLWKKFSTCTRSRSLWKFHRVHVSGLFLNLFSGNFSKSLIMVMLRFLISDRMSDNWLILNFCCYLFNHLLLFSLPSSCNQNLPF